MLMVYGYMFSRQKRRQLLIILTIMTAKHSQAQEGKTTTEKKTFSRTTSVSTKIQADAAIIWA